MGTNESVLYCHCGTLAWVAYAYDFDEPCSHCGCIGNVSKEKPPKPPEGKCWGPCPQNASWAKQRGSCCPKCYAIGGCMNTRCSCHQEQRGSEEDPCKMGKCDHGKTALGMCTVYLLNNPSERDC